MGIFRNFQRDFLYGMVRKDKFSQFWSDIQDKSTLMIACSLAMLVLNAYAGYFVVILVLLGAVSGLGLSIANIMAVAGYSSSSFAIATVAFAIGLISVYMSGDLPTWLLVSNGYSTVFLVIGLMGFITNRFIKMSTKNTHEPR